MARLETSYNLVADIFRKMNSKGQDPLVAAELSGNPSKGTVLNYFRTYKDNWDLAAFSRVRGFSAFQGSCGVSPQRG